MASRGKRPRIHNLVERAVLQNARPDKSFSSDDVIQWMKTFCSGRILPSHAFVAYHLRNMEGLVPQRVYTSDGRTRTVRYLRSES